MDNRIIYREWPLWIYAQRDKEISGNIQKFSDKPSKREMWMVGHLMPYLFHGDEPLFTGIERATVFYRAYESLNKITTNGSSRKAYKWSDDIKSVYYAKLIPKHVISLDELKNLQQDIQHNFISRFPLGSWAIHFSFSLRKPYISRDDTDFYIIDNPVKKEWVFKVPYIAPSQWKGALRSAMVRELVNDNLSPQDFAKRRFRMAVLFGDEQGEEPGAIKGLAEYLDERGGQEAAEKYRQLVRRYFRGEIDEPLSHHKGILHFYPTYFDRIGLEVINPHDRETGAGKQPIYFECVPAGNESKGTFTLLCVPLGEPDMSDEDAKNQAKGDFEAVARGVRAMMTRYGFGAKTSSGFGIGEVQIDDAKVKPSEMKRIWLDVWEK